MWLTPNKTNLWGEVLLLLVVVDVGGLVVGI